MRENKEGSRLRRIPASTLEATLGRFVPVKGVGLSDRVREFTAWRDDRLRASIWPYSRTVETPVAPRARVGFPERPGEEAEPPTEGICFSTQDYLGLSRDPSVHEAVISALGRYGPHAGSSPCLTGHTPVSDALRQELSELTGMEHVVLFPTGWAAGFGAITGLMRQWDHIVLDERAHACLAQGAHAATPNVTTAVHLDNGSVRERLRSIRATDVGNAILVITEGVYSMDSDVPALKELQQICREYQAVLMVDVAHDLGALGPGGTGQAGIQGMLGEIDLVMGSFSKCFATNGGFVGTCSREVEQYLSIYAGSHFFSSALSPLQAAAALQCARIVRSPEGESRRADLAQVADRLRHALAGRRLTVLGERSAIVPVETGSVAVARLAWSLAERRGLILAVIEFPAVPLGAARFRMQLMSDHRLEDMDTAARVLDESLTEARAVLAGRKGDAT
ncbi:aminotransferase class I/II-fold pyridoxal phosphate-dependent enzyme [Actinomadura rubrisoli]|uniref:8-amino-7-oxononanoate synthase n=1 Tax=Actinomadura rubrisoli TaxID=2530368 RepID=A0A4R5B8P7_9ACTN|nr:aminotransferase class I/II-fold pyridoxal phosphate-dependent enzyme [Actinomadura rubrisoli]TDD82678.1 aminotransferase class I/II-fold pyridoxal phosphate-dependent enzyme [Actinomadura rubrisoli]